MKNLTVVFFFLSAHVRATAEAAAKGHLHNKSAVLTHPDKAKCNFVYEENYSAY